MDKPFAAREIGSLRAGACKWVVVVVKGYLVAQQLCQLGSER